MTVSEHEHQGVPFGGVVVKMESYQEELSMAHAQHITPDQRAHLVQMMIQHHDDYGLMTQLSRTAQVSRQTRSHWKAQGLAALKQAFDPSPKPPGPPDRDRAIVILLVEGHNIIRDIQRCLVGTGFGWVRVGTIRIVIARALQRALNWFTTQMPPMPRHLALDDIFGNRRDGASLSIVDAQSGAVWGSRGPLPVDHERWLLLLWEAQDHGLQWTSFISDGGGAIGKACSLVDPAVPHGHDVWHLLHRWTQALARITRHQTTLDARTATVTRQANRCVAGGKPRRCSATTDVDEHAQQVAHAAAQVFAVQYLGHELRSLVSVVILRASGVAGVADRHDDLDALLALLAEVCDAAEGTIRTELIVLHTATVRVRERVLVFATRLEMVQHMSMATLGHAAVQEIAWAWQRRSVLD